MGGADGQTGDRGPMPRSGYIAKWMVSRTPSTWPPHAVVTRTSSRALPRYNDKSTSVTSRTESD